MRDALHLVHHPVRDSTTATIVLLRVRLEVWVRLQVRLHVWLVSHVWVCMRRILSTMQLRLALHGERLTAMRLWCMLPMALALACSADCWSTAGAPRRRSEGRRYLRLAGRPLPCLCRLPRRRNRQLVRAKVQGP